MMYKIYLVILSTLFCSSVMAENKTFTQKLLAPMITAQCENELKSARLWQASTIFMQQNKRDQLKNNICDCVGKNALNGVDKKTMAKAMVNENEKNQLIKVAVLNSLNACVGQGLK